jgi:hypothetical protein
MSVRQQMTVTCDGADLPAGGDPLRDMKSCTAAFAYDGIQSRPAIRKAAKAAGWKVDGFDYCPRHKEMYK